MRQSKYKGGQLPRRLRHSPAVGINSDLGLQLALMGLNQTDESREKGDNRTDQGNVAGEVTSDAGRSHPGGRRRAHGVTPVEQASASAFEALVHPLLDRLYGSALRLTGDATRAEDLVQDACLRAWRFFDKYEPGTNFKAWIFKVMTNLYLNQLRTESRRPETTDFDEIDQRYNNVVGDYVVARDQNPERLALERIESDFVRKTIDALPEMYRVPVVLCDIEGFTYREIADMLEVPIGTVMSRLFRGRKKLQLELMGYARSQGYVTQEAAKP